MKTSLIGAGSIGTEAFKQVKSRGWEVDKVVTTKGVYDPFGFDKFDGKLSDYLMKNPQLKVGNSNEYLDCLKDSDIVYLMIPTYDNGQTAHSMIKGLDERGIPVVTSEKGALSYKFGDLENMINSGRLGFNASVGGGTHMPEFLRARALGGDVREIHCINNASLNFILDACRDVSLDNAIERAKGLEIVEPGAYSPLEIINKEATEDVPRKSAILVNELMRTLGKTNSYISYSDLKPERIDEKTLKKLVEKARNTRYIVSIEKDREENSDTPVGGFKLLKDGWLVKGGFREVSENILFRRILVPREYNAMVVSEGEYGRGGIFSIAGDGAKPKPTVETMVYDTLRMREREVIKT